MIQTILEAVIAFNNESDRIKILSESGNDSVAVEESVDTVQLESILDSLSRENLGNEYFVELAYRTLTEGIDFDATHSRITLDASTYAKLAKSIDHAFNDDADSKNTVKTFIRAVQSKMKNADNERPADAYVLAAINKIYKNCTDIVYEKKDGTTLKSMISDKLSVINKNL